MRSHDHIMACTAPPSFFLLLAKTFSWPLGSSFWSRPPGAAPPSPLSEFLVSHKVINLFSTSSPFFSKMLAPSYASNRHYFPTSRNVFPITWWPRFYIFLSPSRLSIFSSILSPRASGDLLLQLWRLLFFSPFPFPSDLIVRPPFVGAKGFPAPDLEC